MHEIHGASWQVGRYRTETLATIIRDVHVRCEVVRAVSIERHIKTIDVVFRRFDAAHIGLIGHTVEIAGEFCPCATIVTRDPDTAVVGTGEENALLKWRLRDCRYRRVGFGAGRIRRNAAGGRRADFHLLGVIVTEVK